MVKNVFLQSRPWLLAVLALTGFAACNIKEPTYKAHRIAEDLKKLCLHDYGLNVETRFEGGNLQAVFWKVGLVKGEPMEIQPDAAEAIERVLLCATRISLSTDAPLQFLEVKMMDTLSGASITLWRFVPDIRDSMYTRLAEEEYSNRLVVEFDTEKGEPKAWKEMAWNPPMTMARFLAKQVILRVKRQSPIGVQAHEDLSQPSTLVVVLDNWALIEKQGEPEEQKLTDLVEHTMKKVIEGYRFTGFREFVLKDGRGLMLRHGLL
jgi:hypothetical protein